MLHSHSLKCEAYYNFYLKTIFNKDYSEYLFSLSKKLYSSFSLKTLSAAAVPPSPISKSSRRDVDLALVVVRRAWWLRITSLRPSLRLLPQLRPVVPSLFLFRFVSRLAWCSPWGFVFA
jgi:hypothetical protein